MKIVSKREFRSGIPAWNNIHGTRNLNFLLELKKQTYYGLEPAILSKEKSTFENYRLYIRNLTQRRKCFGRARSNYLWKVFPNDVSRNRQNLL